MLYASIAFIILMLIGLPIGYIFGVAAIIGYIDLGGVAFLRTIITRMHGGAQDFMLISIPFFILAAEFMNRGGITKRLINFTMNIIGHFRGGLSHANILVSMLFAGLTGVAITDTVAIGKLLIPEMKEQGYDAGYSAAVTATSSVMGPIIPPSVVMIIYATLLRGVSVPALFAGGMLPGILIGVLLLMVSVIISRIRNYPVRERASLKALLLSAKDALLALLTPVIILGGILFGVTTVAEAAALGAFYALFLGVVVYRTIGLRDIWKSLEETVIVSGVVFLLLLGAGVLGWLITRAGVPAAMTEFIVGISPNPLVQLALINLFLIVLGMFIDVIPAVLIVAPIIVPAMHQLGFDPLHFAIVMLVNINLGNATPPMGMTLMTATKLADISYEKGMLPAVPFIASMILVLIIISYFPISVLWIPRLLGLWS